MRKRCTKCGVEKPVEDFYFHKPDKCHYPRCKPCHNAMVSAAGKRRTVARQAAREAEPDHVCERCGAAWRPKPQASAASRESQYCQRCRKQLYVRRWQQANRARVRQYARQSRLRRKGNETPAYRARKARYVARHRERLRAYRRAYSKRAEQRVKNRANVINRRARVRGAEGSWTVAEWDELKARYGRRCLRCGRSEPSIVLSFDHVIPIARGGPNTIDNAQPLCVSCNAWKRDRVIDYRNHQGRLGPRQ